MPLHNQYNASISFPIQQTVSALNTNQYLTKTVSVFAIKLSIYCLVSFPIQKALSALHINQFLTKTVIVFANQFSIYCSISLPIQCTLVCFALKPILYEDSKRICLSTIYSPFEYFTHLLSRPFLLCALTYTLRR